MNIHTKSQLNLWTCAKDIVVATDGVFHRFIDAVCAKHHQTVAYMTHIKMID
jgi:hypothetical protein